MAHSGSTSHTGSCLSIADIVAVLYSGVLHVDPDQPDMADRDRFILSKGHAGAAVYAVLADSGFFDESVLATHAQNNAALSGHVSHRGIPGVEVSTGSLGHGLGIAAGMALAAKRSEQSWRSFALLSDGEMDEGSTWETILFAAHHRLDNLVMIIDYNKLQSLASVAETLNLEPLTDKLESFGWATTQIDGHDHDELFGTLAAVPLIPGQPTAVVCNTTKGKGISFMEDSVLWHYRVPHGAEYEAALAELNVVP